MQKVDRGFGKADTEFKLVDNVSTSSSLNRDSMGETDSDDLHSALHAFQTRAKDFTGQERQKLRKPEPKKPITERVREAMRLQMEMEMAAADKKAQWILFKTSNHLFKLILLKTFTHESLR